MKYNNPISLLSFVRKTLPMFAVAAGTILGSGLSKAGEPESKLKDYFAVAEALYKDDFKAAKEAAGRITAENAGKTLAEAAAKIATATDIASARDALKSLSAAAIDLTKKESIGNYTVMHCPMVKGGGGDWLSVDGKVNNPYYGAKMPHCGGPKDS